jgi:hypothetical protein
MSRGHKEQFGDSTGVDITRYAQIVHWPLVEGQEITLVTMGTLNGANGVVKHEWDRNKCPAFGKN